MTRVRGTDKLDPPSTYQRIIDARAIDALAALDAVPGDALATP